MRVIYFFHYVDLLVLPAKNTLKYTAVYTKEYSFVPSTIAQNVSYFPRRARAIFIHSPSLTYVSNRRLFPEGHLGMECMDMRWNFAPSI